MLLKIFGIYITWFFALAVLSNCGGSSSSTSVSAEPLVDAPVDPDATEPVISLPDSAQTVFNKTYSLQGQCEATVSNIQYSIDDGPFTDVTTDKDCSDGTFQQNFLLNVGLNTLTMRFFVGENNSNDFTIAVTLEKVKKNWLLGGASSESIEHVMEWGSQGILVAGSVSGSVDIDFASDSTVTLSPQTDDAYIAILRANGTLLDHALLTGDGTIVIMDIYVDDNQSVYVAGTVADVGSSANDLDLDPGIGTVNVNTANDSKDAFLVKLDSNLDYVWSRVLGSNNEDILTSIHEMQNGNILVAGCVGGGLFVDAPANTVDYTPALETLDIFAVEYASADGAYARFDAISKTVSDECITAGETAADGKHYLTGYFAGISYPFEFNGNTINQSTTGDGDQNAFFLELNSGGSLSQVRSIGSSSNAEEGTSVAVTSLGQVYFSGNFDAATLDLNFGAGTDTVTNAGVTSSFVVEMGENLTYASGFAVGSGATSNVEALFATDNGGIGFTLATNDDVDLAPGVQVVTHTHSSLVRSGAIVLLDSNNIYETSYSFDGGDLVDVSSVFYSVSDKSFFVGGQIVGSGIVTGVLNDGVTLNSSGTTDGFLVDFNR